MKKELKLDLSTGVKRIRILTNHLVTSKIVGNYRSVFKGKGLEFLDYRHYSTSDDASTIDWKASVRSKSLLIKEFVEERDLNVFFLIDVSSSMVYTSTDKLKIEYVAELVSTLSYAVIQAGDSVGFAFFNDKITQHSLPSTGFKQYYKLIRSLVNPNYYGGPYDLAAALRFTMAFLKEYSVVIILSDFIGLKGDWKSSLRIMGKKFDLIGIMIRDPRDQTLPDYNGQVILGDCLSNKQLITNIEKIKEPYAKFVEAHEREIQNAFIESNSGFVQLTTDKPFLKPLTDFFIARSKRIR